MSNNKKLSLNILGIFIIMGVVFAQDGCTDPACLKIENVNTTLGTLDVYMMSQDGCSYCTDDKYDNEKDCLASGSDPNSAADATVFDATWEFDSDISDPATCSGGCTNSLGNVSSFYHEFSCTLIKEGTYKGLCSDAAITGKTACTDVAGNTWENNTWTPTPDGKNGIWFTGNVGGFQFELTNINVTGTDGGSAEDNDFSIVSYGTNLSSGISSLLAFSVSTSGTAYIPPSSTSAALTQVTFTNFVPGSTEICFGAESDCVDMTLVDAHGNVLSDEYGVCFGSKWTCECLTAGEVDLGCGCGEAAPSGCDNVCGSTAELDCSGECGGGALETDCGCGETASTATTTGCCLDGLGPNDETPDCAGVCGGSGVLNTDGDGECCATGVIDCAYACDGTATDADGDGVCDEMAISQIGSNLPKEFSISQNYPNPFNPVTAITFDVAEMDEISLIVYDLAGKEVATLVSGTYAPGRYKIAWNAVNNAGDVIVSGMYIYRYISSEKAITRKMLYMK